METYDCQIRADHRTRRPFFISNCIYCVYKSPMISGRRMLYTILYNIRIYATILYLLRMSIRLQTVHVFQVVSIRK